MSAYHAESHRYWCEALIEQFPEYEWTLLSLPARYFSWRIRGNPLSFLQDYRHELAHTYDLCIATSMVDLATLKGIAPALHLTPCLIYFHENQFAYPPSDKQHDSLEPKMVNLYAALAADKILFNSEYNRQSFLQGVEGLMHAMPDHKPQKMHERLLQKSAVLSVPLLSQPQNSSRITERPKLVWNHRWEYDKGPDLLLEIIRQLAEQQQTLRLAIIGQQFRQIPTAFEKIQQLVDKSPHLQLEQWGYLQSKEAYWQCLQESDLVLSTAIHDFQGLAVLEAVTAGCIPVLPNRLVYPEWFSSRYLYSTDARPRVSAKSAASLIQHYASLLRVSSVDNDNCVPDMSALSWQSLRPAYQQILADLLQKHE